MSQTQPTPLPGSRQRFAAAFTSSMGSLRPRVSPLAVAVIVGVVAAAGLAVGLGMLVTHRTASAASQDASGAAAGAGLPGPGGQAVAAVPAAATSTAATKPSIIAASPRGGSPVQPPLSASTPGSPAGAPWSAAVPASPASPASLPASAIQVLQASHSVPPASPAPSPATPAPTPSPGPTEVTGQLSCSSGKPVVGVWVQAVTASGWASWQSVDNATETDYEFSLPQPQSYSLHVGCGGTGASWGIAVYSPFVLGTHNSFNCDDIPGSTGYKTCAPR